MAWTKDQEKAIYKSGQNIIVSAGAGSGKTKVLTTRITHLVNGCGVRPENILAITFIQFFQFCFRFSEYT